MIEKYYELIEFLKSLEQDAVKFYEKGQAAAGTRLRKGMSDVKTKAQEIRIQIQDIKTEKKEN